MWAGPEITCLPLGLTGFLQRIATSAAVGGGGGLSQTLGRQPFKLADTRVFLFFKAGIVYSSAGSSNQTLGVHAAPAAVEDPAFLLRCRLFCF